MINKKIIILILLIISSFIINNVRAETWQCEYEFDEKSPTVWLIEFNNEDGSIKNLSQKENIKGDWTQWMYSYEYKFLDLEITTYETNICPILYVALNQESYSGYNGYDYEIYSDSYLRENGSSDCVVTRGDTCLSQFFGNFNYFYTATLTDSEINKNNKEVSVCPSYNILEAKIRELYKDYNICSNKSCANYIGAANSIINEIKAVCNNLLSYRDVYIEESDKDVKDGCVDICLNLANNINKVKKEYGIEVNDTNSQCGLSERLILWIANIIRWVKYIIPVAVIVLSMLDFIKATGADKEDEIKKAQGKFIRRLIAAVLIFIMPFIIEFVLDKMGFGANGCGIIDL